MNTAIDKLKLDVTAISRGMVPIREIIDLIVPRIEAALDKCTTVDEANEVRAQAEAVTGYLSRRLPQEIDDRKKRLTSANKMNTAYLECCRKAGALWNASERLDGRPTEKREKSTAFISTAEQAGFRDRHDARDCEKASLIHDEDFRMYLEECKKNLKQATLGGLVKVYDLLNPVVDDDGNPVSFNTRPLHKRLSDTAEKILEWREEVGGDIYELMTTAWEALCDAAEIAKVVDE
jgi:hypothetical protein